VNFLVDVNLPPRLSAWLSARNHQAVHLADLDSLRAADSTVWTAAIDRGAVIVSKDTDFYELSMVQGGPPQVLLLALGNCSNDDLLHALDQAWPEIGAALSRGARLVVLRTGRLEVFEE
jgi:predicted nuclease of predicted toxin-antitoxin system